MTQEYRQRQKCIGVVTMSLEKGRCLETTSQRAVATNAKFSLSLAFRTF